MNVEMTKKNLLEAYCTTPEYKAFKEADKIYDEACVNVRRAGKAYDKAYEALVATPEYQAFIKE